MTAVENEVEPSVAASESTTEMAGVRLVFQRFRQASLLLNECEVVTVGDSVASTEEALLMGSSSSSSSSSTEASSSPPPSTGMLVYVSFSQTATQTKVQQAAKTVLNLPIATLGSWGDGSGTCSLLKMAQQQQQQVQTQQQSKLSLLIVPQANLISKVKNSGKSIQYHQQCDKAVGEAWYRLFVDYITELLIDHQQVCRGLVSHNSNNKQKPKLTTPDPSIPPDQLFRDETSTLLYATWDDETGFPLTLAGGSGEEPLTKSAIKKLQKILASHSKRHVKYLEHPPAAPSQSPPSAPKQQEQQLTTVPSLDPTFFHLVAGTFGKRQGLQLVSDMGPFCHVVEL
jgi:hypothetical protein